MRIKRSVLVPGSAFTVGCNLCFLCCFLPLILLSLISTVVVRSVFSSIRFNVENSLFNAVGYTPNVLERAVYATNKLSLVTKETAEPFVAYALNNTIWTPRQFTLNFRADGSEYNNPFGARGLNFIANKGDKIYVTCEECTGQFAVLPQSYFLNPDDRPYKESQLPYTIMGHKQNPKVPKPPKPPKFNLNAKVDKLISKYLRKRRNIISQSITEHAILLGANELSNFTINAYDAYRLIYLGTIMGQENVTFNAELTAYTIKAGAKPLIDCKKDGCELDLETAKDGIVVFGGSYEDHSFIRVTHMNGRPVFSFVLISPTVIILTAVLFSCCACFSCTLLGSISFENKPQYHSINTYPHGGAQVDHSGYPRPAYPQPSHMQGSYQSTPLYPSHDFQPVY